MKTVDVLVVGAGILGTSAAYYIQKTNPKKGVLLIDRLPDVAQGNTARSNALFRDTFTSRDNQILSGASIDCYLDLQKSGIDIGLKKTGYLWVLSERMLKENERHISSMKRNGVEIREFSKAELNRRLPHLRTEFTESDEEAELMDLENVEAAVFGSKCGQLDPSKLSRHYLSLFQKLGGEFSFNTSSESLLLEPEVALGIEGEPFIWQDHKVKGVRAAGGLEGEIRAETVVLACGAWMNELLEPIGIDGHVKAKKRQLFTIPGKGDVELQSLIRTQGFNDLGVMPFVILPKAGCFLKAMPDSGEFWAGCDDNVGRPYVDVPSRNLDDYKPELDYYTGSIYRILAEYFPVFQNTQPRQMWAGLYSYNTLDNMPFVFREGDTGLIMVGGDSGSGIMKGDSLGRIAASAYRGESEAELYNGTHYRISKIGFRARDVEREEWVI